MSGAAIGHRRLDILDTLADEGGLTARKVSEWTGASLRMSHLGLARLVKRRFVCARVAVRPGWPSIYTITPEGKRRLDAAVKGGAVPGVSAAEVLRMRR